jgi:hypothetical protein
MPYPPNDPDADSIFELLAGIAAATGCVFLVIMCAGIL